MSSFLVRLALLLATVNVASEAIFSTKQFYPVDESIENLSLESMDGCRAAQLNMVIRHGTRFPSLKDVKKFDKLERLLRDNFVLPARGPFSWLSTWKNPFSPREEAQLAEAGEREQYGLAKRFVRRLPALLTHPYSSKNYTLRSTGKDRTLQSASAFAFGLFEFSGILGAARFQPTIIESRHPEHDEELRFFDRCESYEHDVKKNRAALSEYHQFMEGSEMRHVTEGIARRLQLPSSWHLSPDDVLTMYKAFAYDVAVFNSSQWSSVFSDDDRHVLAYAMDLKQYWQRGYGYDITWKSSCPLLVDIIESLEKTAFALHSNDRERRKAPKFGIFRFAHAETILPFLCLLGLFRDAEPLRADNMRTHAQRSFRTSKMVPFSTNVAFVLYQCSQASGVYSNPLSSFSVRFLVNEKDVDIPGCRRGGCRLDELRDLFDKTLMGCNLGRMCSARGGGRSYDMPAYDRDTPERGFEERQHWGGDGDRYERQNDRRNDHHGKRRDYDDDDDNRHERRAHRRRPYKDYDDDDDDDDYRKNKKNRNYRHYEL